MSAVRVELGIPTMNNQRTIWATLSKFAAQTRPPDRVHVVDASTDWTPYVVELYRETAQPPFELELERQTDSTGVGAARARIYEEFDGDILACFDTNAAPADDWVEAHLRTHREHPSVDVVSGVSGDRKPEIVESPHDRGFLVQQNCTIKRSALDAVNGWDEQFTRGEDWDLAIRLWRSDATAYVRNDLSRHPTGDEGVGNRLRTRLGRPSSVRFLRKYGMWYAKFHPAHVLGDAVSMISAATILLVFPLLSIFGTKSIGLLLVPLFGILSHIVVQSRARTAGGFEPEFALRCIPEFFTLGYTAMRELIVGPRGGWNYSGIG